MPRSGDVGQRLQRRPKTNRSLSNMVGNWLKRWFLKKVSRKVSFLKSLPSRGLVGILLDHLQLLVSVKGFEILREVEVCIRLALAIESFPSVAEKFPSVLRVSSAPSIEVPMTPGRGSKRC